MANIEGVGERIAELRKNKRLTQSDIASRLGCTTGAFQNYEANRREMNYETLIKLADILDTSIDYLLGRVAEPPSSVRTFLRYTNEFDNTEKAVISAYSKIDDRSKMVLQSIMREMIDRYNKDKQYFDTSANRLD